MLSDIAVEVPPEENFLSYLGTFYDWARGDLQENSYVLL